jgi:hypothetical protein
MWFPIKPSRNKAENSVLNYILAEVIYKEKTKSLLVVCWSTSSIPTKVENP